jgi:hypothetical protein
MKAGSGKAKGSAFEREICTKLSLWVSDCKSIDLFWRSAMSGGRATVRKGAVRQAGDITAVAPEGHKLTDVFYIECKAYKKLSLDCLIKGKGELITFWNIAVKEAAKYQRIPCLIFKQNNWPAMFCTISAGITLLHLRDVVCIEGHIRSSSMNFVKFDDLLKQPFPL